MQLLDSEQLEFAFQAHGITLESEARNFYTEIWAIIQAGEKVQQAHEMTDLSAALRQLCDSYFDGVRKWRDEEEDLHEGLPICMMSQENARAARMRLPGYEKQFFRYVLCYLELNRALIQNRAQLSRFAKDYNIDDHSTLLDVNHTTGEFLERIHHDRHVLLEKRKRLEKVRALLQQFDGPMESLGERLPAIYGHEEGDHQLLIFKGAMRQMNFGTAQKICEKWKDPKVREPAMALIALGEAHVEELRAEGTLMLHSGELSLIMAFLKGDEEKLNGFLKKFNVPYMVFQYRNLIRQGYLLGRIGSIEGLIIQHAKLTSLVARPHGDPALARAQESKILVPVRLQLDRDFRSLGAIFTEVETTCSILEKLFAQTRDYLRSAPSA